MTIPIKLKRGVEADRSGITPAVGEPVVTTDETRVFIGNGATAGGVEISYLRGADVDDTPVDAAIAVPVSSNWAYDHLNETANRHIPAGGTTGQIIEKDSGTDYDISWQDAPAGGGISMTNGTNNYITTATGASAINAESTLTYDGETLAMQPSGVHPKLYLYADTGYEAAIAGYINAALVGKINFTTSYVEISTYNPSASGSLFIKHGYIAMSLSPPGEDLRFYSEYLQPQTDHAYDLGDATHRFGITYSENLIADDTTAAGLATHGGEAISTGTSGGLNMGIDTRTIQARNNGAASSLYLNRLGGSVYVGGQTANDVALVVGDVDDTPVDSATTVPVSSNWAYDFENTTAPAAYHPKGAVVGINAQTGTTYTLVAGDAGKVVQCTNAAAITVSVNDSVHTVNDVIYVLQNGAGQVTIAGSATVNQPASFTQKTLEQYAMLTLTCIADGATSVFILSGVMEAA